MYLIMGGKIEKLLMIIDKLSLVLLKALNKDAAMTWLRERKDTLEKIHAISPNAYKNITEKYGEETANQTYDFAPNMYELCSERVESVANDIDKNGQLYNDFESAMPIYQRAGTISGTSSEIKEFNSIMGQMERRQKMCRDLRWAWRLTTPCAGWQENK